MRMSFPYQRAELWTPGSGGKPVAGPLQSLRRSALHAGLPHPGYLEARRRHRDDGLSPLHRLPLLHGGLPLRIAQLQLGRSPALHRDS